MIMLKIIQSIQSNEWTWAPIPPSCPHNPSPIPLVEPLNEVTYLMQGL